MFDWVLKDPLCSASFLGVVEKLVRIIEIDKENHDQKPRRKTYASPFLVSNIKSFI